MVTKQKYEASIALPMAVLVGSILLLGGISVVMMSLDVKRATEAYNDFTGARLEAKACEEEAIFQMKNDPDYTGTINLSLPDGDCSAVTSNISPSTTNKELVVTSDNVDADVEFVYHVDVSDYPVVVTKQ